MDFILYVKHISVSFSYRDYVTYTLIPKIALTWLRLLSGDRD
jgi:hypothetical protein